MRDVFETLKQKKVTVFGLSRDKVEAQKKFVGEHKLPYDLISDIDKVISKKLGVPVKLGFMSRQALLFKNGKLVWKDEDGASDTQGEDVLAVIEKS